MEATSHGKIILIGEHSVVYNYPAIAMPFYKGIVHVTLRENDVNAIKSSVYAGDLDASPQSILPIRTLIESLQKALNLNPYLYDITGTLPIGSGLGSSAAIASAIVKACFQVNNITLDRHSHYNWTQFSETLAHTNPSGIDALCVTNDNGWFFTKDKIEPLTIDLDAYLLIGNTGFKVPTKDSVNHVKHLIESTPSHQADIKALGQLTLQSKDAIINQNHRALAKAMNQAMIHLKNLGLSTQTIDALNESALKNGALSSKLTGGGMGGCVIALCENHHTLKQVQSVWEDAFNIDTWSMTLKGDE